MKQKGGFTLLEVMVVIIILAILAAIAIPRYMVARDRARGSEAIQQIGVISDEVLGQQQMGVATAGWTILSIGYAANPFDPGTDAKFNYAFNGANNTITATKKAAPNVSTTITFVTDTKVWGGNYPGAPSGAQ